MMSMKNARRVGFISMGSEYRPGTKVIICVAGADELKY
jgi:hypothetical protein